MRPLVPAIRLGMQRNQARTGQGLGKACQNLAADAALADTGTNIDLLDRASEPALRQRPAKHQNHISDRRAPWADEIDRAMRRALHQRGERGAATFLGLVDTAFGMAIAHQPAEAVQIVGAGKGQLGQGSGSIARVGPDRGGDGPECPPCIGADRRGFARIGPKPLVNRQNPLRYHVGIASVSGSARRVLPERALRASSWPKYPWGSR